MTITVEPFTTATPNAIAPIDIQWKAMAEQLEAATSQVTGFYSTTITSCACAACNPLLDNPADQDEESLALHRRVEEKLRKLDSLKTTSALAQFLLDEGIVGIPGNAYKCPLARYLQRELGDDHTITVGVGSGVVELTGPGSLRARVQLPLTLREFYGAFDHGAHSELVDRQALRLRYTFAG